MINMTLRKRRIKEDFYSLGGDYMSKIIPYDEELVYGDGGFIYPSGKIQHCYITNIHEEIADKICFGTILRTRFIKELTINEVKFNEYDGELNEYQFEVFKIWVTEHFKNHISLYGASCDFLLYVLGFDKAEAVRNRAISTCNNDPHVRLFNYYILDNKIIHLPKKVFNEVTGTFDTAEFLYVPSDEDIEMEKEIKEIEAKVPVKERKLFLR